MEKQAILVPLGHVEALTQAVCEILETPQSGRQLGTNARHLVEENFSLQAYVKTIEKLYESILTKNPLL